MREARRIYTQFKRHERRRRKRASFIEECNIAWAERNLKMAQDKAPAGSVHLATFTSTLQLAKAARLENMDSLQAPKAKMFARIVFAVSTVQNPAHLAVHAAPKKQEALRANLYVTKPVQNFSLSRAISLAYQHVEKAQPAATMRFWCRLRASVVCVQEEPHREQMTAVMSS